MKKSVIISIVVIYIFAILTVGFIGIAQKVYDEVKYVERIECLTKHEIDKTSDHDILIKLEKGQMEIELQCRAYPLDATTTKLDYSSNSDQVQVVKNDDGTCRVIFTESSPKNVIITVKSTDKTPGVTLKILIKQKTNSGDII